MATKKLSNSIDEKPQIEDFDETQLKSLLDEAMDYKNPRDANDKSDIFKQLLKKVEEEDNQRPFLGFNNDTRQSNSLQNLLDDSHYHLSSLPSSTSNKKHHQRRKNSTSVSTRGLEGGSLPNYMHQSSAVQSPTDQPFLSEYKNSQKRKEKQKKETVIDMGENETDDKHKLMQRHFDSNKDSISSSYPCDGTEMKSISYTNSVDLEIQDIKYPATHPAQASITTYSSMSVSGGQPISSIISTKVPSSTTTTGSTIHHSVDKLIEFPLEKAKSVQPKFQSDGSTINHNNLKPLANFENTSLSLDPSYRAVTSLTSDDKTSVKSYSSKQINHDPTGATLIQTAPVVSANHTSTAIVTKDSGKVKNKRPKKTNENTIDVKDIQGFRGDDKLEDLLKYIEAGDGKNQKKNPKNGIVTGDHLLSAEEKKKKMAKNKEKVNKLKKSNSMDELCSTGHQQQQQQQEKSSTTAAAKTIQDVTLRSKSSNLMSGGAKKGDKNEKSQPKRNERRSWGTEGLWTEASAAPDSPRENPEETHEVESSSSSSSSGVPSEIASESMAAVVNNVEYATVMIENEFHVVTKKRKVKRKSNEGGDSSKTSNNLQSYKRDGNIRPGTRSYNDRDMNSKNVRNSKPLNQDSKSTSKNRRKSTSSMPPSEDDWNSDGGDSVQSLPIETTKTTSSQLLSTTSHVNDSASTSGGKSKKHSNSSQQQQQQQKPATFSYADIAKTNANRNSGTNVTTSTDKWPSISASSSSTSHQTNDPFNIANFDAVSNPLSNQKSQQKSAPITTSMMSFPELVESNNNKNKQLSSSTSSSLAENASNGETINTTEKPLLNGLDAPRAFDNNNNSNVVADDRNNNQKISYSQSLLENHNNHPELDSNGNTMKIDVTATSTNGPQAVVKAMLTKSKSVDHNNLSSIEHYPALEKTQATLGEVFSKPPVTFETYASKSKQKQVKPEIKDDKKSSKKLKKSASMQSPPQQNSIITCRPAVIILNDSAKPTESDCDFGDFTFGFDINERLLFGHQNGVVDMDASVAEVSLETTNNNNNCDIINTNLSSNLTNQTSSLEVYENFIASQSIVIGEKHIISMKSQSSPKQQINALDSSNQSSNDFGYLSSSLITNFTSPATQKSSSSMPNNEQYDTMSDDFDCQKKLLDTKRAINMDDYKLLLPQFVSPNPVKFNEEELISFVSDEWTKVMRQGIYFNGQ